MHADQQAVSKFTSIDINRHTFDAVMVPVYSPSSVLPVRASGLDVWDQDGRQYLDFTSGIAVTSLGRAHPELVATLCQQAAQLWHLGNGYTNMPVLTLAQTLTEATFADRAFFCNSGAEANEAAFKLARKYAHQQFGPNKSRIVACKNAFHGRTLFTVTVGGQPSYTKGFEPLPAQITHVAFNDIDAARSAIDADVCAVVVEPVQGEGGVIPATSAYLHALRTRCDEVGALLIFDEVQCGMGRTGALFAYMRYGVIPDILTSAKALGNGFPIGAMLTTEVIAATFSVGSHGSTFGGNPLAAAVALNVVGIINTPIFLRRVDLAASRLRSALEAIATNFPQMFLEVRGMGLMLGLVLNDTWRGRAKEISRAAEAHGLMILIAGADVLRFLPALIVSDAQIDCAADLLRLTIDDLLRVET